MKKIHLSGLIEVTFPGLKKIFNGDSVYMLMLDVYKKYYHPSLVLSKSKSSPIPHSNILTTSNILLESITLSKL